MTVKIIFSVLLCLKNFVYVDEQYITLATISVSLVEVTVVTDGRAERSTARHVLPVRNLCPRRIQTNSHGL
jgi:hypothetical protein